MNIYTKLLILPLIGFQLASHAISGQPSNTLITSINLPKIAHFMV